MNFVATWIRDRGLRWLSRFELEMELLLAFAFYAWRITVVHQAVPAPRAFHDTQFYFAAASSGFFSRDIWAGPRAPIPVLVFKICHMDAQYIRVFFEVSSALSWSALAWALSRRLNTRIARILAIVLVFSLAGSQEVLQWNHVILSESLSSSAWALCLAAGAMFIRAQARWLVPLIATAALLALSRDSNAYLVAVLSVVTGAVALTARVTVDAIFAAPSWLRPSSPFSWLADCHRI